MLETTCGEQVGATPTAVPPERHRGVRDAGLSVALHATLVPDSDSGEDRANENENESDNQLRIHAETFRTICMGVISNPHGIAHHPNSALNSSARICAFVPHARQTMCGWVFREVRL